jgi:bacterioferritin-associated ferredoxin
MRSSPTAQLFRNYRMYVCICQQVTDHDIREYCESNNASLSQMRKDLGLGSDCGRCAKLARQIMHETMDQMMSTGVDIKSIAYAA